MNKSILICGPMYAQKSTEALNWIMKCKQIDEDSYIYFKVSFACKDKRFFDIRSHDNVSYGLKECFLIPADYDILKDCKNKKYIVIDEVHFLNSSFISTLKELIRLDKNILLTALDVDYRNEPFETVALSAMLVDQVRKKTSICVKCKGEGRITEKIYGSGQRFEEDGEAQYISVCRKCYNVKETKKKVRLMEK